MARVAVTGVTGYVGGRLVGELVDAGHEVVCVARSPEKLSRRTWLDDVEVVEADVRDVDMLAEAIAGCVAAYYLVHSMDGEGDFAERDRRMASAFRRAAEAADVGRIVYLGGLGDEDDERLSKHLRSRQEVGRTLAEGTVPVVELRAAVVIGSGSASFEMLRHLVEVLPVMVTPSWVSTESQPIAIRDVLAYLVGALDVPLDDAQDGHLVLPIGGPDVVTYRRMMELYAQEMGLRRRLIIPTPVLSPSLSSHWIGVVTPLPTGLARPLVDSLVNETVADTTIVDRLMPRECLPLTEAIRLALRRVEDLSVPSTWADAELGRPGLVRRREAAVAEGRWAWGAFTGDGDGGGADRAEGRDGVAVGGDEHAEPQPQDPAWSGGTVLSDERTVVSDASVDELFAEVSSIGGARGWPVADLLWEVRGLMDTVIGGIGTRRGRRHPNELAVGDPLDFWRVEALEAGRLLRLRAEMKVPGEAWLEFRTIPLDDGRSLLEQRARFLPRGLWGRAYWTAMIPFHAVIFPIMARRLASAAARRGPAARR